jgi:transposase
VHPFDRTDSWLRKHLRELERLLGRKTMEVEILKEALDVAGVKKPSL